MVAATLAQVPNLSAQSGFTENWTGSTSANFQFLPQGGSTITSNVSDAGAADGKIGQLTLPAWAGSSPNGGPNIRSNTVLGFGTYEARLKTANCSTQPDTGAISGFFNYLNDGTDADGNGVKDNIEIDFEWLCAEPNVFWMTMWTDFQESPLAMKRVYREVDLSTGQIRRTCYSEGYGTCTQDLTGNANEGAPSTLTPISGYNSSTAYYTYGFTWASNRVTWYIYHPTTNAKMILWDYRGPTTRIAQRPAYYMFNLWHTNNWPPTTMPGAIQQPNTPRSLLLDWVSFAPGTSTQPTATGGTGATATRTNTSGPVQPTATLPTGGSNVALGKAVTGSGLTNGARVTDGDKNTTNFAGLDLGPRWVQIDLGQSYTINRVKLWHYFGDARIYRDVIVQVSNDSTFATRTTVFNNDANNSAGQGAGSDAEYAESAAGKEIGFAAVSARYVRLWSNGSSSNEYNHYVEAEVYTATGGPVPTATATRTRTNTSGGPSATRTRTNTSGGSTATRTRTNTSGGPSATRTRTRTNTAIGPSPTRTRTNTTGAPTPTMTRTNTSGPSSLKVEYKTGVTSPSVAGDIEPWFRIVNTGSSSVSLSELKLRYYFTADGASSFVFACSWAPIGCGTITGSFVRMGLPQASADWYLEVGFNSGSLAPGANTGDLQLRFHKSDWGSFNQTNDYSFDASKTAYAEWSRVPLYRNGALVWGSPAGPDPTPTRTPTPCVTCPTPTPGPGSGRLFDDFNYTGSADTNLTARNWVPRTYTGGPGIPGASWGGVSFINDPANASNRLLQLAASTNGTSAGTTQSELYHQQKFYEGTYAARVFFTDAPTSGGPDGDHVVETFFTITPLAFDLDPNYGEMDFEYLPNGGWGVQGNIMYNTTWETYRNEPWLADNINNNYAASYAGWHDLLIQVSGGVNNGTVKYYIDGVLTANHPAKYYPETPMSINFNLWFISGGLQGASTTRTYTQHVDWVYYTGGEVIDQATVNSRVASYRAAGTRWVDTVSGP